MPLTDLSPLRADAAQALLPVLGADLEVPLLDGTRVRYAGLDYAATAPALVAVADRVASVLPYAGSVHRGAGLPAYAASSLYEQARARVGAHLGARADDHVVFTRNTTDATNLLAACVPFGGGDVVALDVEHHANLLPWRRTAAGVRVVEHAPTVAATLDRLEAHLADRPAALLAITGATNVTGELLPLEDLVALGHRHGARVFVDAAQLAPHRTVDIAKLDIDYLALSGHKTYAPYGAGVLVGRADWLDGADPYLAGGGAVQEVTTRDVVWHTGPRRHEAGTPNLAGAVAIATALDVLADLVGEDGTDAREGHERALRHRMVEGLEALEGVRVLSIWEDAPDAIGVVAFVLDGHAPGLVGTYLSNEHGLGVRAGRFCAHPLLARFDLPDGALRASFGVGSQLEDVERLIDGIAQFLEHGPRFAYEVGAEGWGPRHDTRDFSGWPGLDPTA
ncbi:MAG: aminotransferase class V-fold PLP-dependent enzyme [Solirubrobacteraceae bacterium]|nr:aminotransferase class V-fold PLP-dependent enzyme [Solirubrobacteraceae bacterium]